MDWFKEHISQIFSLVEYLKFELIAAGGMKCKICRKVQREDKCSKEGFS